MFDQEAIEQIRQAATSDQLTFNLSWSTRRDMDAIRALEGRAARQEANSLALCAVKGEVFALLSGYGMQIVNHETSWCSVTARATVWRSLERRLAAFPDLSIEPNRIVSLLSAADMDRGMAACG